MDWSLTHILNGFLFRHDAVEDPLTFYVNAAELLFAGVLGALFLLSRTRRRLATSAGAAAALALLAAQIVSRAVDRPRPFVAHPAALHLFTQHVPDPGFPSDHATAAFAIAVAVLLRDRRWGAVTLALATLLAVGRVALGLHYPTDVLGGAALGALAALALWIPLPRRLLDRLADLASMLIPKIRQAHPDTNLPT
jgi:undecaprenyl-diphosphatase